MLLSKGLEVLGLIANGCALSSSCTALTSRAVLAFTDTWVLALLAGSLLPVRGGALVADL